MTRSAPRRPNGSDQSSVGARHLQQLARAPRPTGSAAIADARRYCNETLAALGYRVIERPFEYSSAVGAYGTTAGGAVALLVIVIAWRLSLGGHPVFSVTLLLFGAVAIALIGRWLAARGVLALPARRRNGVNLEARRGDADPPVWLVAHLDSKSQPVPLLLRAAGIVLLALSFIAAIALAVASVFGHLLPQTWSYVALAAFVGAVPVMASVVGESSSGAIDNASGVGSVIAAAALLPRDSSVGVLLTDAEEMGLAGARAWCAETTCRPGAVLNCDGVDDDGQLTLMWTRPRAPRLERAISDAAATNGMGLRVTPLVPGVLVDGLAFSNAGWEAVTISHGSLATLRRIHTSGDSLEHLKGMGIASTALVLTRAALTLTERR